MNKLIIVGNGFDLAHGLNTRYSDMIDFFWESLLTECNQINKNNEFNNTVINTRDKLPISYDDDIYSLKLKRNLFHGPDYLFIKNSQGLDKAKSVLGENIELNFKNSFLEYLLEKNELNNWVDIENEFYQYLLYELNSEKKEKGSSDIIKLNQELEIIKNILYRHLELEQSKAINKIDSMIGKSITDNEWESRIINGRSHTPILRTLVVNFNYTNTFEKLYLEDLNNLNKKYSNRSIKHIHIHGDIDNLNTNPIIFGYGDELDKNNKDLIEVSGSEFFRNIKSLNYQFTSYYKDILNFVAENQFEVSIMGHSCGNSDRTLLNTIFEHNNCFSIKPYYHTWDTGDNYFDIVCNIYRNFTKNSSFRERVVEKNLCETLT